MHRTIVRGALLLTVPFAVLAGTPPRVHDLGAVPPELSASVARADAAIAALQKRLASRLLEELEKGGPVKALAVCRDEAQAMTAAVMKEQSIAVGRTSHRIRNPRNAAPAWAEAHVAAGAGKRADEAGGIAVDLGDRVGVLRPIPTGAMCVTCHGAAEAFPPDLARALRDGYPQDRATGFAEGDLRGFFWAEAPK